MKGGQTSLVGPSGKLSAEGRKSWVEAEPQGHMFLLGWGGSSGQGQTVAAGCPHWESAGGTLCSRCAGVQVNLGRVCHQPCPMVPGDLLKILTAVLGVWGSAQQRWMCVT